MPFETGFVVRFRHLTRVSGLEILEIFGRLADLFRWTVDFYMSSIGNLTLRGMLCRSARWYPDREAVVDISARYTFTQLLDGAQRFAGMLRKLKVQKGDRVAFITVSSSAHTLSWFGCQMIGALPVCLHIRETPHLLSKTIDRFSPKVVVYDAAMATLVEELKVLTTSFPPGSIRLTSAEPPKPENAEARHMPDFNVPSDLAGIHPLPLDTLIEERDPAAIVLSSGTTSLPKGVIHTNRTLMESVRAGIHLYHCTERSSVINILSTSFIGWLNNTLPFLNVGGKVVCAHRWNPLEYVELLKRERVTFAFLIPTMWRLIFRSVDAAAFDRLAVTLAGFAGEVMDLDTLQKIRQHFCLDVINMYASTETGLSGGAVMRSIDMNGDFIRSVGKPFLNSDIRIVKPGGGIADEVPLGEPGEVLITGPSVAIGVWEDAALQERTFLLDGENRWWRSGDRGYIKPPNFLFIDGRTDDMIISGGININPIEIEAVLSRHEQVAECAVVGLPDREFGQAVVAFVVANSEMLTQTELERFLSGHPDLARYQRPRRFFFVDSLPRTGTGKVSRSALRQRRDHGVPNDM